MADKTRASGADRSALLAFLYDTAVGRMLLRGISCRGVSRIGGKYMDSRLSCMHISRFIHKNSIDMDEYEKADYASFNQFFTRKIKAERRPVDMSPDSLIAPCDGLLSAYKITDGAVYPIKQSYYTVADLLGGDSAAKLFDGGICLVFRLCVDNYHRYGYIDSGEKGENVFIGGRLHTVRPIALRRYPVFVQNSREYTIMHTDNFGTAAQIEVGALMIGRILNHHGAGRIKRGEEKGMFLYGGSTVVVLLEKGAAQVDELYFNRTTSGEETPVRYGQRIGKKSDIEVSL